MIAHESSTEDNNEIDIDLSVPHISRSDIQNIIGMRPENIDLYRRAFVHKSLQKHILKSSQNVQEYMKESFERLEFVGDAVLNLVIANMLYKKYPDKDEGFLTRLRTKIVRGTNCCILAKKLNLGSWILTGTKIVKVRDSTGCVTNEKLLEDVLESLIGALFLDLGYQYAEAFILKLVGDYVDIDKIAAYDDNFKDILMRYTQTNGFELPIYEIKDTTGPPHDRLFIVSLSLKKGSVKKEYGIGEGSTKKEAEQNACKNSICFNKIENCNIHTFGSCKIHLNEIENLINRDV
jgi:ribonuclease-3